MRQDASRNILWSSGNNNPASRRLNIQSRLNNLYWELRKKSLHCKFDDWKSRNNFVFPSTCSERRGSFCEGGKWSLSLYVSRELWKVCYDINRKSYYAWHVAWLAETTRMHSSRMRTGCPLTVCRGVPPYGGGSPSGGLLGRGVPPSGDGGGGPFLGGLLGRGSPWQGVSFQGVSLAGGVLGKGSPWQGVASQHALRQTPWGGLLLGGSPWQGSPWQGGASFPGGLLPRGSPSGGSPWQGGWHPSIHWGRPLPPWTEWMTGVKMLPWPQLRCGR